MSVATFQPITTSGTSTGYIQSVGAGTFSTIRNMATGQTPSMTDVAGGSSASGYSYYLYSTGVSNEWSSIMRSFFTFDTSSLPNGSIITAATITYNWNGGNDSFGGATLHACQSLQASASTLVATDYSKIGSTSFGSINVSTISGAYTITLNASGIANINDTGISMFALRSGWDLNNTAPTWVASSSSAMTYVGSNSVGGNSAPSLSVTYYPAPTLTGISTIQGLSSITL